MNEILIDELTKLNNIANASANFTHPLDKERVETMANIVATAIVDELYLIRDYCKENFGWSDEASEVVIKAIKDALRA